MKRSRIKTALPVYTTALSRRTICLRSTRNTENITFITKTKTMYQLQYIGTKKNPTASHMLPLPINWTVIQSILKVSKFNNERYGEPIISINVLIVK